MRLWIVTIQGYDEPDVIIYDNKEEASKHYEWAKAKYNENTEYHVHQYNTEALATFDKTEYE
jgi:uncharacterized phage-like protein YoqJ